jgi:hypothetical protein
VLFESMLKLAFEMVEPAAERSTAVEFLLQPGLRVCDQHAACEDRGQQDYPCATQHPPPHVQPDHRPQPACSRGGSSLADGLASIGGWIASAISIVMSRRPSNAVHTARVLSLSIATAECPQPAVEFFPELRWALPPAGFLQAVGQ